MARGAVARENARPLRVRIIAHQRERAGDGHAGIRQVHRARRVALGHGLRHLILGIPAILVQRLPGQQGGPHEHRPNESHVEAVPELPPSDKRHRHQQHEPQRGEHDRADDFRVAGEVLEELEQEQEVPLRTRRRKLLGGIGRCTERGALLAHHEEEHDHEDREAGDCVTQHLLGPEALIGALERLLGRETVFAEQVHVSHDQQDDEPRDHASVQCEEAREREVSVGDAAHQHGL